MKKFTALDRMVQYFRVRRSLGGLPKSSTLKARNVIRVLGIYRWAHTHAGHLVEEILNDIMERAESESWYSKEIQGGQLLVFNYLAERIVVTPINVINLVSHDPMFAHSDVAALNRGLFESAVNICYLLGEDGDRRLKQFHIRSAKAELKIQQSMEKWQSNADGDISRRADRQSRTKNATTSEAVRRTLEQFGDVGQYPNIHERCESLGDIWAFRYDSKYRGLSAWQHGDTTRAFVAQAMAVLDSNEAERAVFETLSHCAWSWDLIYMTVKGLLMHCDNEAYHARIDNLNGASYMLMSKEVAAASKKFQGP